MRSNRQPVATHGNGFGVIPPLSRLRDLPPLATGSRLAMATTSSPHRSRVSAGPFGWFRHVRCERRGVSGGERAHGRSHVRCSESPRAGIADQTDLQWDVAECRKCDPSLRLEARSGTPQSPLQSLLGRPRPRNCCGLASFDCRSVALPPGDCESRQTPNDTPRSRCPDGFAPATTRTRAAAHASGAAPPASGAGACEAPEHSASPRDRRCNARAGRTVKGRLLGSPALMGGTCRCANHPLMAASPFV
jgi:hypothetical protein